MSIDKSLLHVNFNGSIPVSDEQVLQFHPDIKSFLDEILAKGYRYTITDVKGSANVVVDLSKGQFELHYSPEYDNFRHNTVDPAYYILSIELNADKEITASEILSINSFTIGISPFPKDDRKNIFKRVKCLYPSMEVDDLMLDFLGFLRHDEDNLAADKKLFEVAKWLVEEKKFKLHNKFDHDAYKRASNIVGAENTRIKMNLDLTIQDIEKFGAVETFKNALQELAIKHGAVISLNTETTKNREAKLDEKGIT